MATKTVKTATCDTCKSVETIKSQADYLPIHWVHIKLRGGRGEQSGYPIYPLDLCPACQLKALIVLGKEIK